MTPPYGTPPYKYEGSRFISIAFKTSPDILRELAPEPLVANPDNVMSLSVGLHKVIEPIEFSYHEAYLSIPVSYDGIKGGYLPILYLNHDIAIIAGREIWGFSKFEADISFLEEEGEIHASIKRMGVTLVDATLALGEPIEPFQSPEGPQIFNLKLIPSVKKDAPPDVKQLTATTIVNLEMTKGYTGQATLAFGSISSDPLDNIPILEILGGRYEESGFILDYGQVVYDYLSEGD